jgi:hypothetical protein
VDVRGDVHDTGDVDVEDGVTPTSQRGDAHVTQTKKKNLKTEPPLSSTGTRDNGEQAGDEERIADAFAYIQPLIAAMAEAGFRSISWQMLPEDMQTVARVMRRAGVQAMVDFAVTVKANSRTPIGYATFFLRGWLGIAPKSATPPPQVRPAKPPWCGDPDCDETTRTRDVEVGRGLRASRPCPQCHPTSRRDPAA